MRHLSFKTQSANESIVKRDWYVVDATNQTMGRMASKIASVLRGKNKAYYTPHFDCGDYVVVINSGKVVFTGNKLEDKEYQIRSKLAKENVPSTDEAAHQYTRKLRHRQQSKGARELERLMEAFGVQMSNFN
jgi:ribosomal protein L13